MICTPYVDDKKKRRRKWLDDKKKRRRKWVVLKLLPQHLPRKLKMKVSMKHSFWDVIKRSLMLQRSVLIFPQTIIGFKQRSVSWTVYRNGIVTSSGLIEDDDLKSSSKDGEDEEEYAKPPSQTLGATWIHGSDCQNYGSTVMYVVAVSSSLHLDFFVSALKEMEVQIGLWIEGRTWFLCVHRSPSFSFRDFFFFSILRSDYVPLPVFFSKSAGNSSLYTFFFHIYIIRFSLYKIWTIFFFELLEEQCKITINFLQGESEQVAKIICKRI